MTVYEVKVDNYGMGSYSSRGFFRSKVLANKYIEQQKKTAYKNYGAFWRVEPVVVREEV